MKPDPARAIDEVYALGKRAIKSGLWELALARYSQAVGMVQMLRFMYENGMVEISYEERKRLSALVMKLEAALETIELEWGNGHRNPPNRNLAKAAAEMIKTLREVAG